MNGAPLIQVDYEVLDTAIRINQVEADRIDQITKLLLRRRNELEFEWQGQAAERFFLEMDEHLIPRLKRLHEAVQELDSTLRSSLIDIEEAEEMAARIFDNPLWT